MKITKFLTAINELRLCEFDNKKKMGLALDFEKARSKLLWKCRAAVENYIFGVCIAWEIEYENFMVNPRGDIFENRLTHSVRERESRHSSSSEAMMMVGVEKGKVHRSSCMNVCMCSHICLSLYMMP